MLVPSPGEPGSAGAIRVSPGRPVRVVYKSLLDNVFSTQRPVFSLSQGVWTPPADVYETVDSIVIKMEIAGVCLQDLGIVVEGNMLVVWGFRGEDCPLTKENYHLMEVRYGAFERRFALPHTLATEDINAQYISGFLVITVPRRQSASRQIPVEIVENPDSVSD